MNEGSTAPFIGSVHAVVLSTEGFVFFEADAGSQDVCDTGSVRNLQCAITDPQEPAESYPSICRGRRPNLNLMGRRHVWQRCMTECDSGGDSATTEPKTEEAEVEACTEEVSDTFSGVSHVSQQAPAPESVTPLFQDRGMVSSVGCFGRASFPSTRS